MEKREKFISWCDKTMAFSFYALIYFLPISIALSEIFTVLALIFFFLKRGALFCGRLREMSTSGILPTTGYKIISFLKSFKPVSSPLNWPITFILVYSFISIPFSQYRLESLNGFLGKTLQSAFIYFNFIECMNSKKRLKIFINVLLISCALICINGIFQAVVGHGFIHGHIFDGRMSSSWRASNDFAAYLIIVVPVLFYMTFLIGTQKKGENGDTSEILHQPHLGTKTVYLILFLLGFLCLGFTYSRGAWVSFIFCLLLMSLFGLRRFKIIVSNSLLIVFFLFIFYPETTFIKIPFQGIFSPPEIKSSQESDSPLKIKSSQESDSPLEIRFSQESDSLLEIRSTQESGSPLGTNSPLKTKEQKDYEAYVKRTVGNRFQMTNLTIFLVQNNRIEYWRRSLKIIKDYPLLGCGLNTYALVAGRYNIGWGGYPHNSYLQMAAEIGLVGVAVFLWMLFVLFRDSLRALRRIKTQELQMLMCGLLTGLLGFLIHSFFDTNLYSVQLSSFLWVIMGVIVVLPKIEKA